MVWHNHHRRHNAWREQEEGTGRILGPFISSLRLADFRVLLIPCGELQYWRTTKKYEHKGPQQNAAEVIHGSWLLKQDIGHKEKPRACPHCLIL